MSDSVLQLSTPKGTDPKGNSALSNTSESKLAQGHQLSEDQKRIKELEKTNADIKKLIAEQDKQANASKKTESGKTSHVAHAKGWKAVCTEPDLCKVGKDIVAFDSFATLDKQHKASPDVKACCTPVYRKGDMVKGVQANAGKHISSGTSQGSGHVKILDGHNNVKVNNIPIAKHDSNCMVNCDADGNGGAKGKLVTEQKSVSASATPAANPEVPPGKRSSEKLEKLKDARAKLESGQLDLNALDEYVNFKDSNSQLDGLIGQIKGTPGSAGDYAAQATRGVLDFVKDGVMGIGEMAYEGIKAVPKLVRRQYTDTGQAISQLDGQIFAENIKLGNITPGTLGQDALNIGKGMVKPVTDPWKKGQYVESGTRAVTEIGTFAFGWIKGSKAAQAAKAAEALKAEEAAEAARVAAENAAKAQEIEDAAGHVNDGVHVKGATAIDSAIIAARRTMAEDFYRKSGIPESKIDGHLSGIDFTKPVDIVTLEKDSLLSQFQMPGGSQGNYFSPLNNGSSPSSLGISGQALDRTTGEIINKLPSTYEVIKPVEVLRSSAAPIMDTWSIPGSSIQTTGGARQFFTTNKTVIVPKIR